MPLSETRANLNSDDDYEEVTVIQTKTVLGTGHCISVNTDKGTKKGQIMGFPGDGNQPDGILLRNPGFKPLLLCENTENKCSAKINATPVTCDYSTIKLIDCDSQKGGRRYRKSRKFRQSRKSRQSRQSRHRQSRSKQ